MRRVLGNISVAIMQSQADAERIRELGMPADRLLMQGNIKFDGAELSAAECVFGRQFSRAIRVLSGSEHHRRCQHARP